MHESQGPCASHNEPRVFMPFDLRLALALPVLATLLGTVQAAEFDLYGGAAPDFVAPQPTSDFVFVLGLGAGMAPVYEGASEYGPTFSPIIKVERLYIPGFLDIGAP